MEILPCRELPGLPWATRLLSKPQFPLLANEKWGQLAQVPPL